MTTSTLDWLRTLADAEATVPARVVLARIESEPIDPEPEPAPASSANPDRLLTVKEAAERLGVDRRWVYRHQASLPFTRKLTSGTLRFSEKGIERYLASRR